MNITEVKNRKEHVAFRLLVEGDHLGEIGLLYNCPRSCTIISRNFNNMASLDSNKFREITYKYPYFKKCLLNKIYKYKDPNINFMKNTI